MTKVLGKWNSPSSDWITINCYPWGVSKIQKFPFSILMQCGSCDKETWNQITEKQESGIDAIICPICKKQNFI